MDLAFFETMQSYEVRGVLVVVTPRRGDLWQKLLDPGIESEGLETKQSLTGRE